MAEKRTTYKIQDVGGIGEVKIADEVVTIIVRLVLLQKLRALHPWAETSQMNW